MDDPIKSVETYLVDGGWRNFLFVRIETAGGVEGWGEATLGWKEFAVAQLVNELGAIHVVGKSPFDIERVWFTLFQSESNIGPVILSAMAGIEMAMWDIAGKLCGQPVVNLVGGAIQTRVRAYANGWYSEVEDPDALRAAAAGVVAKGYTALKFDPFGAGGRELDKAELRKARAIVAVVRDEVGPDVDIMIRVPWSLLGRHRARGDPGARGVRAVLVRGADSCKVGEEPGLGHRRSDGARGPHRDWRARLLAFRMAGHVARTGVPHRAA
jgi:L-alanine-DL-glutamate epimerase-like enolase superfamily enzyme